MIKMKLEKNNLSILNSLRLLSGEIKFIILLLISLCANPAILFPSFFKLSITEFDSFLIFNELLANSTAFSFEPI